MPPRVRDQPHRSPAVPEGSAREARLSAPETTEAPHPAAVLQRAALLPRSLTPGDVLHLQRALGNRAVGRLLASASTIQRARLKATTGMTPAQHVSWYFSGEDGKDMLKAETEVRPGNSTDRNRKTAINALLAEVCRERNVAYVPHANANNLRTNLITALRGANVLDDDDVFELDAAINAKLLNAQPAGDDEEVREARKPLSAKVWKHIWRGDYNANKKRPTGYHWKGRGGDAWMDTTGGASNETGGFYNQAVVIRDGKSDAIRAETGAQGALTNEKDTLSTFFPDAWSEQRVKDTIELRDSQNNITSEDVPDNVKLHKQGDTIFPVIE